MTFNEITDTLREIKRNPDVVLTPHQALSLADLQLVKWRWKSTTPTYMLTDEGEKRLQVVVGPTTNETPK